MLFVSFEGTEQVELVIHVQHAEAISLCAVFKVHGLKSRMDKERSNLVYRQEWKESKYITDAYEKLTINMIHGEGHYSFATMNWKCRAIFSIRPSMSLIPRTLRK